MYKEKIIKNIKSLKSNVDKMYETNNIAELDMSYERACARLNKIFDACYDKIKNNQ